MSCSPRSLDGTLSAGALLLRPWQVEDAAWYVAARDEEVLRWTTERRDLTVEQAREGIRRANSRSGTICRAIVDAGTMQLLGNIALVLSGNGDSSGEIMYWLAPAARGRGIATAAVELLCRWAFDTLGLESITMKIRPGNVCSERVAQHSGFQAQDIPSERGEQCLTLRRPSRSALPRSE